MATEEAAVGEFKPATVITQTLNTSAVRRASIYKIMQAQVSILMPILYQI